MAAAVVGACGSGEPGDALSATAYGQRVHTVVLPLFASLKAVGAAKSADSVRQALRTSETSVRAGIHALRRITPPSAAADANEELLSALDDYEAALEKTETALAHGSSADVQGQIASYDTQSRAFGSVLVDVAQKLRDAGIQVGPGTSGG